MGGGGFIAVRAPLGLVSSGGISMGVCQGRAHPTPQTRASRWGSTGQTQLQTSGTSLGTGTRPVQAGTWAPGWVWLSTARGQEGLGCGSWRWALLQHHSYSGWQPCEAEMGSWAVGRVGEDPGGWAETGRAVDALRARAAKINANRQCSFISLCFLD